jgi:hypothetical protein
MNRVWFTAALIAATLVAWLKLVALDGDLATAERKTCGTGSSTPLPGWSGAPTAHATDSAVVP